VRLPRAILALALFAAAAWVEWAPRERIELPSAATDIPDAALPAVAAPDSIEDLQRQIAAVLERDHIPGAAIALVGRDGPIWIGGVGERDLSTHAPVDGDTVFRVGSLSKSVIALGVMRLVDQGKLDVDRPLREILPDVIDNPWEATAPVTLAQCLEHTAGLDDVRFNEIFTTDERLSVRDTLALNPRSRHIRWQPGTRHSYSNVGYTLAARAIEVASGEPFDQYIHREILEPMGITDADFARTAILAPRLATGYTQDDRPAPFQVFAHRPSGALLSSARDLGKLVHFWIVRGEGYPPIVSAAGLARIERSGTLPYPHLANDYGLANYGDVRHPVFGRGHDGGMPGFHASFRYFPSLGVGYVMLINSNYTFQGYFELRSLLFAYLTHGRTFAAPPAATASSRPGADYFALANPGNEVLGFIERISFGWRVAEIGDGVRVAERGGETIDVIPTDDGGYREPHHCGSSLQFATNADGKPIILPGFGYGEAASFWPWMLRFAAASLAMLLLHIAPLWAGVTLALGAIYRQRVLPYSLVIPPAIAGLCCSTLPIVAGLSFERGVIGIVHPLTIAICAVTILFALVSIGTLVLSIVWMRRADRPPLWMLLFPTACGVAFTGLTLWVAANGWIGLRTWAW
jgi:CubicO group peptidase (beta-lactamase class C family)